MPHTKDLPTGYFKRNAYLHLSYVLCMKDHARSMLVSLNPTDHEAYITNETYVIWDPTHMRGPPTG
jgi:hypothetical protein